jgi:hypothetical protein
LECPPYLVSKWAVAQVGGIEFFASAGGIGAQARDPYLEFVPDDRQTRPRHLACASSKYSSRPQIDLKLEPAEPHSASQGKAQKELSSLS